MVWWRHSLQSKHLRICTHPIVSDLCRWCLRSTDLQSLLERENFAENWDLSLMPLLKFCFYPKNCLGYSSWWCVVLSPCCLGGSSILFCWRGTWWRVSLWRWSLFPANGMEFWLVNWSQHPFVIFSYVNITIDEQWQLTDTNTFCLCDLFEEKNNKLSLALTKESVQVCLDASFFLLYLTWHEIQEYVISSLSTLELFLLLFYLHYFDSQTSHHFLSLLLYETGIVIEQFIPSLFGVTRHI